MSFSKSMICTEAADITGGICSFTCPLQSTFMNNVKARPIPNPNILQWIETCLRCLGTVSNHTVPSWSHWSVRTGQLIQKSNASRYGLYCIARWANLHVLLEENGAPTQVPGERTNFMQRCMNQPAGINLDPSWCEVIVLTTAPLRCLSLCDV